MSKIEDVITEAIKNLQSRENVREDILLIARKARMLSKQSILTLHSGNIEGSKARIDDASKYLKKIEERVILHPEMAYLDSVQSARQEFTESAILLNLIQNKTFPSPESVNMPVTDYIMGLADVPGELRRRALDMLREGNLEEAEKLLDYMEQIYLALVQAEEASLLLKGLRRKMDITRMVNERTRSEITNETGRQRLSKEIRNLREKLSEK